MSTGKSAPNYPGQHFLSNKRVAGQLVRLAGGRRGDLVIDIGAGTGVLTALLAERGRRVLAVESDPVLAERLRRRFAADERVRVLHRDFLRTPLPRDPFGVVSNLPFHITTPVLGSLMDRPGSAFQGGLIIVELGAALRFTRSPVTDPRILGWRTWFDLEIIRTVDPGSFSPPPGVRAAVLRIRRKGPALLPPNAHSRFAAMVESCLRDPYAPVARALRGMFTAEQVKRVVRSLHVERHAPVCTLTPSGWTAVYETMRRYVEPHRQPGPAKRARPPTWSW